MVLKKHFSRNFFSRQVSICWKCDPQLTIQNLRGKKLKPNNNIISDHFKQLPLELKFNMLALRISLFLVWLWTFVFKNYFEEFDWKPEKLDEGDDWSTQCQTKPTSNRCWNKTKTQKFEFKINYNSLNYNCLNSLTEW